MKNADKRQASRLTNLKSRYRLVTSFTCQQSVPYDDAHCTDRSLDD